MQTRSSMRAAHTPRASRAHGALILLLMQSCFTKSRVVIVTPEKNEDIRSLPVLVHYQTIDPIDGLEIYLDGKFQGKHGPTPEWRNVVTMLGRSGADSAADLLTSGSHTIRIEGTSFREEVRFNISLPSPDQPQGEASFGISTVLFVGDFRQRDGSSARFAMALEEAGVGVYRMQEDETNADIIQESLRLHSPGMFIYQPWLGLVDQAYNPRGVGDVWLFCAAEGIVSVALLPDVRSGMEVGGDNPVWGAQFVASPDGTGRLEHVMTQAGLQGRHILVPSSAMMTRREVDGFSLELWRERKRSFGLGPGPEEEHAYDSHPLSPDGFLYDVLFLGSHSRQEHLMGCPFPRGDGSFSPERSAQREGHVGQAAACCAGPGWGLRSRVLKLLQGRSDRVRVELAPVKGSALRSLLAVSKVTVVVSSCMLLPAAASARRGAASSCGAAGERCEGWQATPIPCPSAGFWGGGVYDAVVGGGFVVHDAVPGMGEHLGDGRHLALFDAGNLSSLSAVVDFYLEHAGERERIRRAGQRHVWQQHTLTDRMETMLHEVAARLGGHSEAPGGSLAGNTAGADSLKEATESLQERAECDPVAGARAAMPCSRRIQLQDLVRGRKLQEGVEACLVDERPLPAAERVRRPVRSLPEDRVRFEEAQRTHWVAEDRGASEGLALLGMRETTVTAGMVLCNASHVITAFSMHGPDFQSRRPPGCFGSGLLGARQLTVPRLLLLPVRWGNSWQHFVQDVVWLLQYAEEAVPSPEFHILLESRQSVNNYALLAALLGPAAADRVLFVDHECMTGALLTPRRIAPFQCSTYFHATELFIPVAYPRMAFVGQVERAFLRSAQQRVGGYVATLLATLADAPNGAARRGADVNDAAGGDWLWQCRSAHHLDRFEGCQWLGGGPRLPSTSPILLLSRRGGEACGCTDRDRCLVNEEALKEALGELHAAVMQSGWHRRESPHPLELQPGQEDAVALLGGDSVPLVAAARLVREAEVIVAPHGGQCYNLVFARPGTVFVEISPGRKASDGPYTMRPFAQGLGLQVWITLVPGVAHRRWDSVRPFEADITRVAAILLLSFEIPPVEIASLSLEPASFRRVGSATEPGSDAVVAVVFKGSFIDQIVREQPCAQEQEACVAVQLVVNGEAAAEYVVTSMVGMTLNGSMQAVLPGGTVELHLLLVDQQGRSLGVSSPTVWFDAQSLL